MLRRVPARLLQLQQAKLRLHLQLQRRLGAVIVARDYAGGYYRTSSQVQAQALPESKGAVHRVEAHPGSCSGQAPAPPPKCKPPSPKGKPPPPKGKPPPCDDGRRHRRGCLWGTLAVLSGLGALYYFGWLDDVLDWLGLGCMRRYGPGAWAKFPGLCNPRRRRARHRHPPTADDLPPSVAYLVVGGGSAGLAAARSIRRFDRNAQVLILSSENAFPYQRTPLSKELWQGEAGACFVAPDGKMHSVFYEPESFYIDCKALSNGASGVALARGWEVSRLHPRDHKVILHDGSPIHYERCLLATGCSPYDLCVLERARPEVKKKVQSMHDVCDFESLRTALEEGARDVVVVGGSSLACELAASLVRFGRDRELAGLRVSLVFPEETPHSHVLPAYLGRWLTRRLQAEGVRVVPNAEVRGTSHSETHAVLRLSNGECLPACRVVVAAANAPNTDLASFSGIKLDRKNGGFRANEELRADNDVWAAGDCVSYCDPRFGRIRVEGMDHALESGSLAGQNMVAAALTEAAEVAAAEAEAAEAAALENPCPDQKEPKKREPLPEGRPQEKYEHLPVRWGSLCPGATFEAVGVVDTALQTVGVFAPTGHCPPLGVHLHRPTGCDSGNEVESVDYSHGVVFYLRDNVVVGVLLWNMHRRLEVARQIIEDEIHYDDLDRAVQQLCIHS